MLFPFYRWGNCNREKVILAKVTMLVYKRIRIGIQAAWF